MGVAVFMNLERGTLESEYKSDSFQIIFKFSRNRSLYATRGLLFNILKIRLGLSTENYTSH